MSMPGFVDQTSKAATANEDTHARVLPHLQMQRPSPKGGPVTILGRLTFQVDNRSLTIPGRTHCASRASNILALTLLADRWRRGAAGLSK